MRVLFVRTRLQPCRNTNHHRGALAVKEISRTRHTPMKIALAQFNPTIGDFDGNVARILELDGATKKGGASLVFFSELRICGYPPPVLVERPFFPERNQQELVRLAKKIPLPSL